MNPDLQSAHRPLPAAQAQPGDGGRGASAFGLGGAWPGLGPGADWLQGLAQAARAQAPAGLPPLAQWLTPTLDPGQLAQRISELKTVQFWLEQNIRAIATTVQTLEVQKLTIESLQRMNQGFADAAEALRAAAPPGEAPDGPAGAAGTAGAPGPAVASAWPHAAPAPAGDGQGDAQLQPGEAPAPGEPPRPAAADALAWWGALGQQFQAIAQQALRATAGSPAGAAPQEPAADQAPPPQPAPAPRRAKAGAAKAPAQSAASAATAAKAAARQPARAPRSTPGRKEEAAPVRAGRNKA